MTEFDTETKSTWCPGCFNFQILAGVKSFLQKSRLKKDNFALVSGIGCHAKLFDYINLDGLNTLHGRVLPACFGIKMGNPNLNVLGFAGDGDAYAEGMAHLIHTVRYNPDINYFVFNNQVFALTVGQPTPVTEIGYTDKTTPQGVKIYPMNPIKLMLASGASFVARVFANAAQIEYVLGEALKHKGFSFIEVIQPCLVFHPDENYKDKMYSLDEAKHDKTNFEQAWQKAQEFDYNSVDKETKIPLGIFYQVKKPVFEDQFPQLVDLKKKKIGWKDIRR